MAFLLICLVFGLPVPVILWAIHNHQSTNPRHKQRARIGFILFALLATLLAAVLFTAGLSYEWGSGNQ
jgi:hypothetical protein